MFDGIEMTHVVTKHPLTSRQISEDTYKQHKEYERENLSNSEFVINGSADIFREPPVSEFAIRNLYYVQAFSVFHYKKDSYTRRRDYHSYLCLYTYSGTGHLEYEGKEYTLEKGDGVFINCTKPHYYRAKTDWEVGVFHFHGPLAGYMSSEYEKLDHLKFHEETNGRFQGYLEQVLKIYSAPSLYRELRVSHVIEEMLIYLLYEASNFAVQQNNVPGYVQKLMGYLEKNFTQDISLDQMAALVNTSKYHLSKEFKKYTGFSPHDYLISLRINHAKILLKTTDYPANKIAHIVGIHDINNFNYLFKKKVGKTPIQFRKSNDIVV